MKISKKKRKATRVKRGKYSKAPLFIRPTGLKKLIHKVNVKDTETRFAEYTVNPANLPLYYSSTFTPFTSSPNPGLLPIITTFLDNVVYGNLAN